MIKISTPLHGQLPGSSGQAIVFCGIGGHAIEKGKKWELVPVRVVKSTGACGLEFVDWKRDETSPSKIPCCEDCKGELL